MRRIEGSLFLLAAVAFAQQNQVFNIEAGPYALQVDEAGNIKKILSGEKSLVPPAAYSFFELDGKLADAERVPAANGLSYALTAGPLRGVMKVFLDRDIQFRFEPSAKDAAKDLSLVLTFPLDTVFHLAEHKNTGRRLDRDMPVGESFQGNLYHNFFAAKTSGMWLRFRTAEKQWMNRARLHVVRHPQMFTATFTWRADAGARLGVFSSLEEVLNDHRRWLESETGIKKLKDRPGAASWLRDIQLIVTVDMMRSNWEITHDFADLLNLGREIARIRDPRQVLLYLPGWQGPYDSTHPTYRPHPELGGEKKFREALDFLHKAGFHVMVHSTIWGIDPYRQEHEKLVEQAAINKNGEPYGWMITESWVPAKAPLKFRTPRKPLPTPPASTNFSFKTEAIPDICEAFFSIGGVKAPGARIRLTSGRRTISTPAKWLDSHDAYDYPFALALSAGQNDVTVTVEGGSAGVDWSKAWYRIRETYRSVSPYQSWTFPILMADTTNPEYQKAFIDNLRSVIKEFGIDALHIDAGGFHSPVRSRELLYKLRDAIPNVPLSTEYFDSFEEMGYWSLTQGAKQELRDFRFPHEQGSATPMEGLDELYAWLLKPSPICSFVKEYVLVYPHLCAANAFVPVGKVCNIEPPRLIPPRKEELWKVLARVKMLDYVPGLRVNYRKYGLDADTQKALRELGK